MPPRRHAHLFEARLQELARPVRNVAEAEAQVGGKLPRLALGGELLHHVGQELLRDPLLRLLLLLGHLDHQLGDLFEDWIILHGDRGDEEVHEVSDVLRRVAAVRVHVLPQRRAVLGLGRLDVHVQLLESALEQQQGVGPELLLPAAVEGLDGGVEVDDFGAGHQWARKELLQGSLDNAHVVGFGLRLDVLGSSVKCLKHGLEEFDCTVLRLHDRFPDLYRRLFPQLFHVRIHQLVVLGHPLIEILQRLRRAYFGGVPIRLCDVSCFLTQERHSRGRRGLAGLLDERRGVVQRGGGGEANKASSSKLEGARHRWRKRQ
mmetsp:Transcript_101391/g.295399  ORF Transcript_101391/g.295399 Transcript_101391/m.295399 type:complete len:318 (-) Transcript_101391:52-1005(-)